MTRDGPFGSRVFGTGGRYTGKDLAEHSAGGGVMSASGSHCGGGMCMGWMEIRMGWHVGVDIDFWYVRGIQP